MLDNSNIFKHGALASTVLEQMICFLITDKEGRYVYANSAWQELMGFSFDKAKGKKVKTIVPDTKIEDAISQKAILTGTVTIQNRHAFSYYIPILNEANIVTAGAIITILIGNNVSEYIRKTEQLIKELSYYRSELSKVQGSKYSIDNIVGNSPGISHVKEYIRKAAQYTSSVLIQGETGSGKELVAHAIHDLSARRSEPFVKVNCAGIPETLMESIFFGYDEGSFTGAKKRGHIGKFEQANRGTIFLDEISELSPVLQPKLLRALQEKEIERVGGSKTIPVDIRLITCSNIPLEELIHNNLFRADLFYRINVITINIPPLRERLEDIGPISSALIDKLNDEMGLKAPYLGEEIISKLKEYDWPGNVRELSNALEYAMNMAGGKAIKWENFGEFLINRISADQVVTSAHANNTIRTAKYSLEKNMIVEALYETNNNKSAAAKKLGISRTLLYKKIKQYNL